MTRIIAATPGEVLRHGGFGDNWHMTWCADGSQLAAMCDGTGLPGTPEDGFYNAALYRVAGDPHTATFERVDEYPRLQSVMGEDESDPAYWVPKYFPFGTLAVDGSIYQFRNTFNKKMNLATEGVKFNGAKLIYSPDGGRTWCNQDGTTPVRYEGWTERSRETMVFLDEPDDTFSLHSVLQMGRDYSANTDGYVYVYSPNGHVDGTMNELVMLRVRKDRILDRSAYEYFAGIEGSSPRWSHDIRDRRPTVVFPRGWVNTSFHPYAWQPSVVYDEPLRTYLMACWAPGVGADGWWFRRPSYLGMYSAPDPWGPWEQFLEDTSWTPEGDDQARCYSPVFAPKWISEDGRTLWLVFTDFGERESPEGPYKPHYAFNLQQFELQAVLP